MQDFESNLETGFQMATFQGPLCAEPVQGMAYFVEKLDVNEQAIHGEDGELYRFELRNAAHSILSTFQISISERITDLNCP